ncbi:hypothetical protein G4G29_10465 [Microbacterium sp. Se63.02b]|nr:hypothetical protein G4G29_10465 [Microbacterium sp. Se63.02b]
MLQKDLASAAGMSQAQVSVRLKPMGPSIPIDQVVRMCGALGLDVPSVFREAEERAKSCPTTGVVEPDEDEQTRAVGRRIAASLWVGADDPDFIVLAIDQNMFRDDNRFWTPVRKQLALMWALHDLAYTIGRRYPIRDPFILKPVLESDKIIP